MGEEAARLEFDQSIKWSVAYQRNNKANGQKNLRCFPGHCQGLGHQRGFCGHSLMMHLYMPLEKNRGPLLAFGQFTIADSELNSEAIVGAKGISRERFVPGDRLSKDMVQQRMRQADQPLLEYIEGLELQDRRVDPASGIVRVNFEFNRNLKGWHYGFLGSKLTRNVRHVFKAYVIENVPACPARPEHFVVIASITSPEWTLYCRRRNRNTILTAEQLSQKAAEGLPPRAPRNMLAGGVDSEDDGSDGDDDGSEEENSTRVGNDKSLARPSLVSAPVAQEPVKRKAIKKRRDTCPPTIGGDLNRSTTNFVSPPESGNLYYPGPASYDNGGFGIPKLSFGGDPRGRTFSAEGPQPGLSSMDSFFLNSAAHHIPLLDFEKPQPINHVMQRATSASPAPLSRKRPSEGDDDLWDSTQKTKAQQPSELYNAHKEALTTVLGMFQLQQSTGKIVPSENNMDKISKSVCHMCDVFCASSPAKQPMANATGDFEVDFCGFLLQHQPFVSALFEWGNATSSHQRNTEVFSTLQFALNLFNDQLAAFKESPLGRPRQMHAAASTLSLLGLGSLFPGPFASYTSSPAPANEADSFLEKKVSLIDLGKGGMENRSLNGNVDSLANFTESLAPLEESSHALPAPSSWRFGSSSIIPSYSLNGMSFMLSKAFSQKSLFGLDESKHSDDLDQFLVGSGVQMVEETDE